MMHMSELDRSAGCCNRLCSLLSCLSLPSGWTEAGIHHCRQMREQRQQQQSCRWSPGVVIMCEAATHDMQAEHESVLGAVLI